MNLPLSLLRSALAGACLLFTLAAAPLGAVLTPAERATIETTAAWNEAHVDGWFSWLNLGMPSPYPFHTEDRIGTGRYLLGRMSNANGWAVDFSNGLFWLTYARTGEDPVWHTRALDWSAPRIASNMEYDWTAMWQYQYNGTATDLAEVHDAANDFHNKKYAPALLGYWGFNWDNSGTTPWDRNENILLDDTTFLPILALSAKNGGNALHWSTVESHFEKVFTYMVRPDGSTAQIGGFEFSNYNDPGSAVWVANYGHQGISGDSTWSRGQGWFVNGGALLYKEMETPGLLDKVLAAIDYHIENAPPDGIPYWDYDGAAYTATWDLVRDTSAAALLTSGMFELMGLTDDPQKELEIFSYAEHMLDSLSTPEIQGGYSSRGGNGFGYVYDSLITQGAYWVTRTFAPPSQDNGLIWGDFYAMRSHDLYAELLDPRTVFAADPVLGDRAHWWERTPARWRVEYESGQPRYRLRTPGFEPGPDGTPGEISLLASRAYGDFDFTVEVKTNEFIAENPQADVCVIFGWEDTENYAYLLLSATSGASGLYLVDAGVKSLVATAPGLTGIPDYTYHTVRVVNAGGSVTVDLNGSTVLTGNYGSQLQAGRLGLGSIDDSAYFDNPVVAGAYTSLPEPGGWSWAQTHFGSHLSFLAHGDYDLDGDGLTGRMEKAAGRDPWQADTDNPLQGELFRDEVTGDYVYEIRIPAGCYDLAMSVEETDDVSDPESWDQVPTVYNRTEGGYDVFQRRVSPTGERLFFRTVVADQRP